MITSVGNNTLQALTALNAFKGVNKSFNSNSQPAFELETSNGLQVNNRADILKVLILLISKIMRQELVKIIYLMMISDME